LTDGFVVVDKPSGCTSHDVVARMRRIAGTRKVGHAGTLDPMATGVLLIGVGRATRLLGYLASHSKAYEATIRLGQSTTTDDAEGELVSSAPAGGLTSMQVRAAVAAYVGQIEQVPSAVSAVKVRGERAYRLAGRGEQVGLPARTVRIEALDVRNLRSVGDAIDVEVCVTCSSGTYVRALARDIGADLGVGGHLTALRRTRVGPYGLADARTLDALERRLVIEPMSMVAQRCFATYALDAEQYDWVLHGRCLPGVDLGTSGPVAMLAPTGELVALYEEREGDACALAVLAG
jgi:tRNA pseudouridine55 synthase